ncbi:hypothetical protein PR048_020108 [Dryococelus australis]|uniref:Integrase catalytic domain-containing protein n=1 Tax=Dryococelus australis TaxID=614101 RepID=A0ABQ9H5D3_9NEOP|nr:hypothetical protein PR048_020108 [Dryococelus australis]
MELRMEGWRVSSFLMRGSHQQLQTAHYRRKPLEILEDCLDSKVVRIVVGMSDVKTSEQHQLLPELTLEQAILAVKQAEVQSSQSAVLYREHHRHMEVHCMQTKLTFLNPSSTSYRCKSVPRVHERSKCPARNAQCFECNKPCHWALVCRVYKSTDQGRVLNDSEGVEPKQDVKQDGHALSIRGYLEIELLARGKTCIVEVYVISGLPTPILGRECLKNLGIVCIQGDHWNIHESGVTIRAYQSYLKTYHKPLQQILHTNTLDELYPRLQRFQICFIRYDYSVQYVPGKELMVADCLSRSPETADAQKQEEELTQEAETIVQQVISIYPDTGHFLSVILLEQEKDPVCIKLKQYATTGWPKRGDLTEQMYLYYQFRHEITFEDRFFEIVAISFIADEVYIRHLKEVFSRFGIPEIVRADSGTQFLPLRFREFSSLYNFTVITSSSHYHQSNGGVEAAVKAKRYNKRHRVRQIEDLKVGELVWISDLRDYGMIQQIGPEPRSYIVRTSRGDYRRNTWFLVPAPYNEGKVVVNRGLCNSEVNERETPVGVDKEESGEDFKGFEMDKGTDSTEVGTRWHTPSREGTLQTVNHRSDRNVKQPAWIKCEKMPVKRLLSSASAVSDETNDDDELSAMQYMTWGGIRSHAMSIFGHVLGHRCDGGGSVRDDLGSECLLCTHITIARDGSTTCSARQFASQCECYMTSLIE